MDIMEVIDQAKDNATVSRVFGEPITREGVTVVPVAKVATGGGGGRGKQEGGDRPGEGSGGGYGLSATPAGVFVIKDGDVRWQPAIDVNRIVLGGQIVGVVLLLTVRAIVRMSLRRRRGRRG
ncbi:sporulation protein [Planomonospora sp. ID67723]|uniref:spore germination protein GerW family protein n=1 Tax=Planomonospora sp. ID67723 TaxID=2738134 RepID=UPI0018C3D53B|nr:spore germination protein GerW family protein [Planomonospora sp. ID67723]MBG0832873.1 sporulation protein [Planomonospora sp. ID67723]